MPNTFICRAFGALRRNVGSLLAVVLATAAIPGWGQAAPTPTAVAQTRKSQALAPWEQLLRQLRDASEDEKVAGVNRFFNRNFVFQSDWKTWGQQDYWATPEEFMTKEAGDCEDFAVAKYVTLRRLGVSNTQLRLMYVMLQTGALPRAAHMVLGYTPALGGEPLILDNLITSTLPMSHRRDLSVVFEFNNETLWRTGSTSVAKPTVHLSQWAAALNRMHSQGWDDLAVESAQIDPSHAPIQLAAFD